jgi:plasmid stabilization system protein ParE
VPRPDRLYEVIFDRAARQDLNDIFDYVAARAGSVTAERFTTKLHEHCVKLEHMPERGTRRDELRRGLRTIGYRRRATILFEVDHERSQVIILGVYYGGRNYRDDFSDEAD